MDQGKGKVYSTFGLAELSAHVMLHVVSDSVVSDTVTPSRPYMVCRRRAHSNRDLKTVVLEPRTNKVTRPRCIMVPVDSAPNCINVGQPAPDKKQQITASFQFCFESIFYKEADFYAVIMSSEDITTC